MNAKVDITGVKLETERLILREWNLDDLDDFFEYAKNPDVGPRAGWFPHKNKEESLEILKRFIKEKKTFAIVYKENNKVIGSLGIEKYGSEDKLSDFFDYQGREIGYVLSKDYWGKGLMPEAVNAVIRYLFNECHLDFLLCGYYDFNNQSKRAQEKCGFKPYRKLNFETRMGTVEPGVLSLLKNPRIVECDRFYLREYQENDYADLSEIYQDAENMKYFGAPYDDKMMRRLIDWTMENYKKYGFGFWAIIDKKSGEFIGDCGLSLQKIDGEWLPEIGYHIKLKYHNMGYASEAAQLVKAYIFKNYTYNALYGYTTKDNIPSIKVMMKNGMSFVKEFSKDDDIYVVYSVKR